ncbi:MAG: riboflavin synthase, partial [Acutalibacteraceae bacterium]|nr:riboflavin synthase [Acutalibacteraceae bacterium]
DLLRYIVEKGSICIDGISLTVAAVDDRSFQVSIIPHTRAVTNLSTKGVGSTVNLECDVIGKYVEKLLGPYGGSGGTSPQEEKSSGITEAFLREYGF